MNHVLKTKENKHCKENKTLKNAGKLEKKNTGKVREFCQSGKVGSLIMCIIVYNGISAYRKKYTNR